MENFKNNDDNVSYSKYKVKYITKAGEVKYYEHYRKYTRKGRGLEINKIISNDYNDILKDDKIKAIDKAIKIYGLLSPEDKKKTSIEKIRGLVYRIEYNNVKNK